MLNMLCGLLVSASTGRGDMAKYIVTIEGFYHSKSVEFEADSLEAAEEIGEDIFHEKCNYGVSPADEV